MPYARMKDLPEHYYIGESKERFKYKNLKEHFVPVRRPNGSVGWKSVRKERRESFVILTCNQAHGVM